VLCECDKYNLITDSWTVVLIWAQDFQQNCSYCVIRLGGTILNPNVFSEAKLHLAVY